jgi:hypothetical protein
MDSKLFKHQEPASIQKYSKKNIFLKFHQYRTQKHVSDPMNGSAAKRINMFFKMDVSPRQQS